MMFELADRLHPWRLRAACRGEGIDAFWGTGKGTAPKLCERCPVRRECADYAHEHGIAEGWWGGESGKARARRPGFRRVMLSLGDPRSKSVEKRRRYNREYIRRRRARERAEVGRDRVNDNAPAPSLLGTGALSNAG